MSRVRDRRAPQAQAASMALPLCLLTVGCGAPPSEPECQELMARYVELLMRAEEPDARAEVILRKQVEAKNLAAGDPRFRECSSAVSRRQYECAMKAPNADRLEQCLVL